MCPIFDDFQHHSIAFMYLGHENSGVMSSFIVFDRYERRGIQIKNGRFLNRELDIT